MEWWEVLVQQTINGLTRGAVFALIALGYTMVYGIIELINFAHGDVFMLGLFVSLSWFTLLGVTKTLTRWQLLTVLDRKSTRLNSSHSQISYAVFCLKKKKTSK